MKKLFFCAIAGALTLSACNQGNETKSDATVVDSAKVENNEAASAPTEATAAPMSKEDAEKAYMSYMTPGQEHEMMKKDVGRWTVEMKSWMHPDSAAMESKGSADIKMVMGGRYQEALFKSTWMGQPFEGRSLTAFDNTKKTYINTWIDNMGTGMMIMEGKPSTDGKTMTFVGKMTDPISGKDLDCREVWTIVDDKTQLMEMYSNRYGKEAKEMEMKMIKQ